MSQLSATSGLPRLKRLQTADMNARLAYLPQMLAQKSQSEYQDAFISDMKARQNLAERQYGMDTQKFNLSQQEYGLKEKGLTLQEQQARQAETQFGWQQSEAEKAMALRKESEQKQMGVTGAGLGFNLLSGGMGKGLTLGNITDKASGLWSGLFGKEEQPQQLGMGATQTPTTPAASPWRDINAGAMFGGGLVGAGAGQVFGGTNKLKKSAIGLGVGGLAGFLGGGGDWGSALGGGILGGLGSLI